MAIFFAYLGFSMLTLVVFHLVVHGRWNRRSIQDLMGSTVTDCRGLLDLEKTLKAAYQESGIPKVLQAAADVLTLLYGVGVVLAWIYLPTWYYALGATVLLPLAFTILFYQVLEFAGPWWGFPAAYIRGRLRCEEVHDWDGCQCRNCRTSRGGGHRWDSSCRCSICGAVRHQWKATECMRCGAKRESPPSSQTYLDQSEADSRQVQVPLS